MRQRADILNTLIPFGIFLAGFAYYYEFRQIGWFVEDEGVLYYQYLRTHQGQLPYRDYFMGYTPFAYYLHAWIFEHFGVSIDIVRKFMAAVNAMSAAGLFVISRRVAPLGFALIPPALFLVMQPGDIGDVGLHNVPYPFWYSLTFFIWGTWALFRFLESRPGGRGGIWLLVTGLLGGLILLTKQSAGIFFLWGASGFLASHWKQPGGTETEEPGLTRMVRLGYLALIPVGAVMVIKNFMEVTTLALFILPMTILAAIGARRRLGAGAGRAIVIRFTWLAVGVVVICAPWVAYFSEQMGLVPFLNAIFYLNSEPDRNLYIAFPRPAIATLLFVAPLTLWTLLARSVMAPGRIPPIRNWLRGALLLAVGLGLGGLVSQRSVIARLLAGDYGAGEIYLATSTGLDNLAAYLSILVLACALAVVLRPGADRLHSGPPSSETNLCLLWMAAPMFLQYYPRMDSAHLLAAVPLLYVVGAALLPSLRESFRLLPAAGMRRTLQRGFHVACLLLVLFVVGVKVTPRVYSRIMLKEAEGRHQFVPTPTEWLRFDRATLHFPIYDEARRRDIRAFSDLITYIGSISTDQDPIFAFPAMPMIYFVSQRDNPTRHDYFLGNNVSFREHVQVIRTLEKNRVPIVVISNDPGEYFAIEGKDFTRLIRTYLQQRYYLDRRFGNYDLLRRFDTND